MLGLGLSITSATASLSSIPGFDLFILFYDRVIADGGTIEAQPCLISQMNEYNIFSITATYWVPYKSRVIADGGTAEAQSCLISKINLMTY